MEHGTTEFYLMDFANNLAQVHKEEVTMKTSLTAKKEEDAAEETANKLAELEAIKIAPSDLS